MIDQPRFAARGKVAMLWAGFREPRCFPPDLHWQPAVPLRAGEMLVVCACGELVEPVYNLAGGFVGPGVSCR